MALSDITIRKAQPTDKQYKLTDGEGLYLLVTPKGGKYWRYDYRFDVKRKTYDIGTYPDVPLKLARERKLDARILVADGIDPNEIKKANPPVPAIIPVSESSWWSGVKNGKFPKPYKLGERTTVWKVEDILALIHNMEEAH